MDGPNKVTKLLIYHVFGRSFKKEDKFQELRKWIVSRPTTKHGGIGEKASDLCPTCYMELASTVKWERTPGLIRTPRFGCFLDLVASLFVGVCMCVEEKTI